MTEMTDEMWWNYDRLPSGAPYSWGDGAARGDSPWDNIDFHLDLGCGRRKKGRLGIDRYYSPEVDLLMDLETLSWVPPQQTDDLSAPEVGRRSHQLCKESAGHLPFPDDSIESIISHHAMEHIADGFIHLMDECHRVLVPGGVLRIIVPLFPSTSAVEDPDHCRYFMQNSFNMFCGMPDGHHWADSFSVPYTSCRFEEVDKDMSPPTAIEDMWTDIDSREIRIALRKWN